MVKIGIRREDKNIWERRVPLIPDHVGELAKKHKIEFLVQPSDLRIFKEQEYEKAGAKIGEDLSVCKVVFAVKEMPNDFFRPAGIYIFFSHTIKGQAHNMPMLKKLMGLGCTLIDYERVVDLKGRRLIFFGRHAGLAGMADSLWALGKRYESEGIKTPFLKMRRAHEYKNLDEMKKAVSKAGKEIAEKGLPEKITPFVCGFAGYGNVSHGAQEIYGLLPVKEITPRELPALRPGRSARTAVYKVVFKEEDMVEPSEPTGRFELQDYYKNPEKYRGTFEKFVPYLSVLMNCIYWAKKYPRLVTIELLKKMYGTGDAKLKVIGDISCDVSGAVEATVKCTDPGNPVFVYDVDKGVPVDGWKGNGPVILAVDNLPCEIAGESSHDFSAELVPFLPAIADANYTVPFEKLALPREIKDAVIVYRGELAPNYKYLEKFLGNL